MSGRQRTRSPVNLFPSPLLLCSAFVLFCSPFKFSPLNSFSGSYFPPLPLSLTRGPLHNPSLIKVTLVPAPSPEPSLVDSGVTSPSGHDTQEGPPTPSNLKRAGAVTGRYVLTQNARWNVSNHNGNVLFLLIFLTSKSDGLLFQMNRGFLGRGKGLDTTLFGHVNGN